MRGALEVCMLVRVRGAPVANIRVRVMSDGAGVVTYVWCGVFACADGVV